MSDKLAKHTFHQGWRKSPVDFRMCEERGTCRGPYLQLKNILDTVEFLLESIG